MHRLGKRAHVIGMGLRGVVGIVLLSMQWVFCDSVAQSTARAIEDRNADAEGSEIDTGYEGHDYA
jgi:hypothetical protein